MFPTVSDMVSIIIKLNRNICRHFICHRHVRQIFPAWNFLPSRHDNDKTNEHVGFLFPLRKSQTRMNRIYLINFNRILLIKTPQADRNNSRENHFNNRTSFH